jgi:recombination protein RecA
MSADLARVVKEHASSLRIGSKVIEHHRFPTGILSLDVAMGNPNGLPGGTLVQLLGESGCGKTTVALKMIAKAQSSGVREVELPGKEALVINAVLVDFEASYDPIYAKSIGIDVDKLMVIEADSAEEALTITEELIRAGVQIVCIDSVSGAIPADEWDKTYEENAKLAGNARINDRLCRRLTLLARKFDVLVLLINQFRANMSPMARSEKKAGGGFSLRYFSKVIIEFSRIKNTDTFTIVQAFVVKNKVAPERKRTEFTVEFGVGVREDMDVITLGVNMGIVNAAGARYEYEGIKAHGMAKACAAFPIDEIRARIISDLDKASQVLTDTPEDMLEEEEDGE